MPPRTLAPPIYATDGGHIAFCADGAIHACWRLEQATYRYRSRLEKLALHAQIRAGLMQLSGNARLWSICRCVEPAEVGERMIDGLPMGLHTWEDEALATVDLLVEATHPGPFYRQTYLAVQLPTRGRAERLVNTAAAHLARRAGTLPPPPTVEEVDQARRDADRIAAGLGGAFTLTPVTPGELRWLTARAARRGVDEPVWQPGMWPWQPHPGAEGNLFRLAADVWLDHPDDVAAVLRTRSVGRHAGRARLHLPRRYVTVRSHLPDGEHVGYQTCVVLAGLPREGEFPGGELFDLLDTLPDPVDWTAFLTARSNEDARRAARRQFRHLIGQVDEWSADETGPPPDLEMALDSIQAEMENLAANGQTPELETTIVFTLAATHPDQLDEQAGRLARLLTGMDASVTRPVGSQRSLYAATLPLGPAGQVVRDYRQYLDPDALAGLMPTASTALGDPTGMLAGYTLDAGSPRAVFIDPARGPREQRTGSVGIVGALGSGKSWHGKNLMWATVARGGQAITLDRNGEYARAATVLPGYDFGRVKVVELTPDQAGTVTVDPMRLFAGEDRTRFTIGFLSLLAGVGAYDPRATELAQAVHDVADRGPAGTSRDVLHLLSERGALRADADQLARQLDAVARGRTLARLVFDPDGQPLDLTGGDVDAVVLYAPTLALPSREKLANPELAARMLPEEIVGLALAYLLAAIQRRFLFADRGRFALALL